MERKSRPTGRQKNYGPGSANVHKRGSGLGRGDQGPVGNAGGYSDRPQGTQPEWDGSDRGTGGYPSGGSRGVPLNGRSLKGIIILVVVAVGLYLLFSSLGKDSGSINNLVNNGSTASDFDKGAYPVVQSVSPKARNKYTVLKGNKSDKVTVMVYLCGTDLESKGGMATADLQEMMKAQISDQVNIIVETGGTAKWNNNIISNKTNQRYRVTSKGLEPLEQNLGKKSMVKPETLSDFIKYCSSTYPADRYILILWDHGGGSTSGYGYDQNFPNDSMTLDEINIALKNGGCVFDIVGFDACLMATLETAIVLEPYADYMIASEEVEPGIGWYYTGWITELSGNTSIASTDLGKILIDDYVKEVRAKTPKSQATLSLIDLAEMKGTVPEPFAAFAASASKLIDSKEYKKVSDARAGTKEFAGSSQLNQIDLVNFAETLGTSEAKDFAKVLRECVKYNRTSTNIVNANGLSIYFPKGKVSSLGSMLNTYDEIGIDAGYSECLKSFASLAVGGQATSSGSGNVLQTLLGNFAGGSQSGGGAEVITGLLSSFISGGDFSSITGIAGGLPGWLDIGRMKDSIKYYEDNRFDASALKITKKDGRQVLELPDKQWELIQNLELNVFLDDGEGYIDLGLDNVYDFNDSGDLIMEFDGTWLALNGNIVSYYMVSEDRHADTYSIQGRVPALLNGQLVDIILVFDNENPNGKVLGAQIVYDTKTQSETTAKGLLDIIAGDKIDYLCDYYTYDGEFNDAYYLGEQYTATGSWNIQNIAISNNDYLMTYRLTDIYNNRYWTPSISG